MGIKRGKNKMKNIKRLIIICIVCLFTLPVFALERTFSFSAKIGNTNRELGTEAVIFEMYTSTDPDATVVWQEEQEITFVDGFFDTKLGKVVPLDLEMFNEQEVYVKIKIQGFLKKHQWIS